MEQIYYTQCPVGYGLGASNGFQIKRMTPRYPVSGDFRHLGLRAFPGGGRVLAPPALRYRRDGDVAEVAWLAPRAHEYETERGLWGRPGGLFAHGVRLSSAELAPIRAWPAGLWDSPAWCRSDPEPSRGRPPASIDLASGALTTPPEFSEVARLSEGMDPEHLARLLAAVARATREGRTLFLIAEPGRLGPTIGLLTFAFPEAMRGAVTFSTFHDRPEELPGFRIQGTSPMARPNRPALAALGIVADLAAGSFEPTIEPPAWARTLAGWFVRHEPIDEADWSATDHRARFIKTIEDPWSDAWLDHLVGFPGAYRSRERPDDGAGWVRMGSFAAWSGRAGVADEWLRPRGPAWWLEANGHHPHEARAALLAHLRLPQAWRDAAGARGWGEAFALWFGNDAEGRDEALAETIRVAPRAARPAFARALLGALPPPEADAVLARLRSDPSCDRGMLLPLEADAAATAIRDGGDPAQLRALIESARTIPGVLTAVLDAVAKVADGRPDLVPTLARAVAPAFAPDAPDLGRDGLAWALRRDADASSWLGPALRPFLANPERIADWRALRDRTPEASRPVLVQALLDLARDPRLPADAFRWGVEEFLLPMSPRPSDPSWAETYLARMPSGLDLMRRLVAPEFRKKGLPDWLEAARRRGEVSPEQSGRIDDCLALVRSLRTGDAGTLLGLRLPGVPAEARGALLHQMLAHLGGDSGAGLPSILDAARHAWLGGFDAGAPGLDRIAVPLARQLRTLRESPPAWLERLSVILDRLRPTDRGEGWGFEPEGLVAEVVATSTRLDDATPWPIRQHLLRDERAWKALLVDARRDLLRSGPENAAEVVERWDHALEKSRPERFFELMLNACDGPSLARVVAARVADLRTLPSLSWWDHAAHPDATDDLREAVVLIVPMAPLPEHALIALRSWIGNAGRGKAVLSAFGAMRWRCLDSLSAFARTDHDASTRWAIVRGWSNDRELIDALAAVSDRDRHRFVARMILGLEPIDSLPIAPLARWLERANVRDIDRLSRWAEELDEIADVENRDRVGRMRLVGELRAELLVLAREAREVAMGHGRRSEGGA